MGQEPLGPGSCKLEQDLPRLLQQLLFTVCPGHFIIDWPWWQGRAESHLGNELGCVDHPQSWKHCPEPEPRWMRCWPIAVEPPVIMTKFLFFNFVFPYGCYYNRISNCVNHNAFKKDSNVNLRLTVFWIGSHMLKHGEPLVCPVPVFGLPRTCSTHRLHAGWWLPTYWYGAEDPGGKQTWMHYYKPVTRIKW